LERAGLPFAPINRPSDLFDDEHLKQGNGLLSVTLTDGPASGTKAPLPALPLEFDQKRTGLYRDLPESGADVESILCELGFSAEEYVKLRANRAVD
jgi:crotonobetainyl-CoA:carnitine CoA-transferase CaiB-like acyl-CoA transferase